MNGAALLEIAVDSLGGALVATAGGAQRLELCTALAVGGLTPSAALLRAVRRACDLPLFVLVRCRPGGFRYRLDELSTMVDDVRFAKDEGADGVVVGALADDGRIDRAAIATLRAAAPLPVTFHRAFDAVPDPHAAADTLIELGVDAVLSSGGAASAWDGRDTLRALQAHAAGRLTVIAGGGVRADRVADLLRHTGVGAVHSSAARREVDEQPGAALALGAGGGAGGGDATRLVTCADEVRRLRAALA